MRDINSPDDIKNLSVNELAVLSDEVRQFLVSNLSQTGGHLASNLGVVELTIALHKVFDTPQDKIIWDVGHQSYVHKLLTGRRDKFHTLRKLDGLSGFPKSSESEYDAFNTGHSSTSISAALGLCAARDLNNENHKITAVIGDGSMTGGLAYEALNNAGRSNTDLLVILNDNQMSISKNVGALSRHLNDIRTASLYRGAKRDIHKLLKYIPRFGKRLDKWIETVKDAFKFMLVPGGLFEELGFQYFGPVDGHNLKDLIRILGKLRDIKGPVLLHAVTKKGKGYPQAEESPDTFHGVDSFNLKTGEQKSNCNGAAYTDIFGKTMTELGDKHPNLVAITAAMTDGTGLCGFKNKFPDRFFDVGIAEAHAVTFAAGMAKGGALPVAAVYSSFLQRAYDQILHDVCTQNLHVIFAIDRAGITGADGETHQGLFDISFLSHMPNMTIMAPKNRYELEDMLNFAVSKHKGPVAIRYPRSLASKFLSEYNSPIEYGKSETIIKGDDIAVITAGAMIETAYEAAGNLRKNGFNPSLYNARFIKPFDIDLRSYRYVFILEDNVKTNGYGEQVSAATRGPGFGLFSFPDKFIEQGTRDELFLRYGLDADSVTKQMLKILRSEHNVQKKN